MRLVAGAVVTAVAIAASAGSAAAADFTPVAVPMVTPVVIPPPPPGFSWGGFYLGVGTSAALFFFPDPGDWEFHLSGYAGLNFEIGSRLVAGAEAYATVWDILDTPSPRFGTEGRLGYLLNDRILAYGAIGIANYGFNGGNIYLTLGTGVEIALGRRLSLDLAYDFERGIINNDNHGHRLTAALNFHFGQ